MLGDPETAMQPRGIMEIRENTMLIQNPLRKGMAVKMQRRLTKETEGREASRQLCTVVQIRNDARTVSDRRNKQRDDAEMPGAEQQESERALCSSSAHHPGADPHLPTAHLGTARLWSHGRALTGLRHLSTVQGTEVSPCHLSLWPPSPRSASLGHPTTTLPCSPFPPKWGWAVLTGPSLSGSLPPSSSGTYTWDLVQTLFSPPLRTLNTLVDS